MRKLVIARGHPGSGKSHLLREVGLEHFSLSADALRSTIAGAFMTSDGRMIVSQEHNDVVYARLKANAAERMARGEMLAIDTTLTERGDLKTWTDLAKRHRYRVVVVDMGGVPLEVAYARTAQRNEYVRVPEHRIAEMHRAMLENPLVLPEGFSSIAWQEDGSHAEALRNWLREPIRDLGGYDAVVHIGDIQGCFEVLAGPGAPFESGLRDDRFYVFIGDLIDRGVENGRVVRWFMDHALGRDNVVLLHGNHEDHLQRWANSEEAVSNEFALRTLPQLVEAGIRRVDAGAICDFAREFLHYDYRGTEVIATHAGLPVFPRDPHLLSLRQLAHGTGSYGDPVDQQFERSEPHGYQVHGHRNQFGLPVRATEHSFNLEDAVEFGGNLRLATLDRNGWSVSEHRNRVFRPHRERLALETRMTHSRQEANAMIPHWMREERAGTRFDPALLEAMKGHKGVVARSSKAAPHIESLNFSKAVFWDASWDDVVVKARGLFYAPATLEIVARSYEKFFNIGEREDTRTPALLETLTFPVRGFVKENGFLGIIGYDASTDSLFVSSKSTPDSPFTGWFRTIIDASLDPTQQDRLRRYLRDNEASMVFEVIDPANDPHIIEYGRPKMILLDIVRRSTQFERASYDVVLKVADRFGLEAKRPAVHLKTPAAFMGWVQKIRSSLDSRIDGELVEGVVLEDATGSMVKLKAPFYSFWKQMRSQKDRILAARTSGKPYARRGLHVREDEPEIPGAQALADSFLEWCHEQDDATLGGSIVALRNAFSARTNEFSEGPAP